MKKSLLTTVGVIVLSSAVLLAGCAQGGAKTTGGAAKDAGKPAADAGSKFPTKPVTLIVPFAPGGSTDLLARAMEKVSSKHLGQQLTVINKPGGGSTIGWNELVQSKPDGYTVGSVSSSISLRPIFGDAKYNYLTELEPLAWMTTIPQVLAVKADSPYKTLDDLIKYAKENPGKVKYGHSGLGNTTHIAGEMFAKEAGVKIEQVPFNSGSEVVTALLGGHIAATFATPADFQEHFKAGKLRPIAVASDKRFDDPLYTDVPSFKEKGLNVDATSWNGIAGPKNLPADVKAKLVESFKKIAEDPEFKDLAEKAGLKVTYAGAEDFGKKWNTEFQVMDKVVKETGILEMVKNQKK
jgi:tripartite-type tricarboxylate transporter receptor subunit TctC